MEHDSAALIWYPIREVQPVNKRVVVAMSGGVDSSVAAALLKDRGYEVIGITMNLFDLPTEYCRDEKLRSCCGRGAVQDAHQVAMELRISHYVADLRKDFEKKVIEDFCREYSRGRTPNPCLRCNEHIKFDVLVERADRLGADYIATGHHARVEYSPDLQRFLLKKGKDRSKDQSYFLYILTQKQLARTLLPIGYLTKGQVRKKAQTLGLPVASRPESQEICFIPDRDYGRFLMERRTRAFRPGPIVDRRGRVLGQHSGIHHFTIGQRRGMGIAAPHPLYVLEIDPKRNAVIVGTDDELKKTELFASSLNWISVAGIDKSLSVKAKIRYTHRDAEAEVTPLDGEGVRVKFAKAQRAITPGQAVVFYRGEIVVGGGTIELPLYGAL